MLMTIKLQLYFIEQFKILTRSNINDHKKWLQQVKCILQVYETHFKPNKSDAKCNRLVSIILLITEPD